MKKGFTLIELLAVIVILAIIALIATPIVLDIIDSSKKNSNIRSAEIYMDAVKTTLTKNQLDGKVLNDGFYSISEVDIKLNGDKPSMGYFEIRNGNVERYNVTINNQEIDSEQYDVWNGIEKSILEDNNSYYINTSSELAWISNEVNNGNTFEGKIIYLNNNLDLNNKEWTPIGNSDNKFLGTFEGNNHIIKNLYINDENQTKTKQGLFGDFDGTLNNLILINVKITSQRVIGAFAGSSRENAKFNNLLLYNAYLKGKIDDMTDAKYGYSMGGIVGQFSSDIYNSKVINLDIEGSSYLGGLIGRGVISDSTKKQQVVIDNCEVIDSKIYSNGSIGNQFNFSRTGGLVGQAMNSLITNSRSFATINSKYSTVGGFIGESYTSIVENNYSNSKISSESEDDLGYFIGYVKDTQIINNIIDSKSTINNVETLEDKLVGTNIESTLEGNLIK